MSAIGVQSQINKDRALWLSTIPTDVIHGEIICDTILANAGYISSLYTDNLEVSTLKASTLSLTTSDVSGMYVSSLRGNTAFFSSLSLASDLSGGVGSVTFQVDASGISVTGDPIVFNNLVYLTSTINIVQVSTIVDTDIFASNGYFSTLSSGSLSSGLAHISSLRVEDLSANYGAFNTLSVSSLATNHISSLESGSNWSLWPTQASSIIFQPAYVLSNVSNKLYFAGQELTDASGGGIDWSYFPAQTDVSMNNFSVRGLSTLQYQDGARLYSQTGNNLFYNGQPVQFGATSNVSQWANYPAVNTIQTGGFPISSLGNVTMTANSNIRFLADSISSVADQGLLAPAAYSDINLTAQNGLKGRINLTANAGAAGIFGEVNITANGGTTGGIGTGGLITLNANTPLGFSNATSAIKMNAAGVNSYAGAIPSVGSLAGYNFIYGMNGVNICAGLPPAFPNIPFTTYLYGTAGVTTSSDFYCPNIYPYYNGLTTPPDLNITGRVTNLQQVYVNLSNVKHIYMQGSADIQNANLVSTISTIGQSANFNSGIFTTLGAGTGVFINNNSQTLNANTISTSYVQAPLLSTININLSTINGVDWQDISGGVFTTISSFNTGQASTFHISTLAGFFNPNGAAGSTINVETGLQFVGQGSGGPNTGKFISSLKYLIADDLEILTGASANWGYSAASNGYVRIGGGAFSDSKFRQYNGQPVFSTQAVMTSSIITSVLDISGGLTLSDPIFLPLSNAIQFDDGSLVTFSQFQYRDVANNGMVALTDTNGLAPPLGSNMRPLGVGELWLTGATDQFAAVRLYSEFPYGNYELDAIDADGSFLFAYMQGFENGTGVNPGYCQAYSNVSSISGYNNQSAANPVLDVIGSISTGNLNISSINGFPIDSGSFDNNFSTINTSSLAFSTLYSSTATTNFYYPIFIDHESDGPTAGAAIAIRGHDSNTGAVIHQIEMGWRASDGANYIAAVWPGQNLEDLSIEGEPVKITDGIVSTIFNTQPYAMQTTGGVAVGVGSGLITLSTGVLKVGGQTNLTGTTISSTQINTPYGNNFYTAGQQQPCVFHGNDTLPGGGATQSTLITLPTAYTTKDFVVNLTYKDGFDNSPMYWSTQTDSSFLAFGGHTQNFSWATFGNLPFTG